MIIAMITGALKRWVQAVQEFTFLLVDSVRHLFSPPRYLVDTLMQMDVIGFGSLPIVLLIGFFTGGVLALQSYRTLSTFGEVGLMGKVVALSLVLELGPVLTALMMAGRNSSGIASEIGSMVVSEQVDAMRALGTDPSKKLVTPRVIASMVMLFFLTVISDFFGVLGGAMSAGVLLGLDMHQYLNNAWQSLKFADIFMGLAKPVFFGFIVASIGCYYGLSARGGTQGVGRATTQAVVASSVFMIIFDFLLTRLLMVVLPGL